MSTSKPRPRRRGERGTATVELVVLLPLLFTILFAGVQGAVYYHARTLAIGAAQEGARAAASEHGTLAQRSTITPGQKSILAALTLPEPPRFFDFTLPTD